MKYLVFFISTVLCVIHCAESATNDDFIHVHGNKEIRIIGGKDTTIEKYPYQVAILAYQNETTYLLIGSGALIRLDKVLTVARLTLPIASKMAVIAGETSIGKISKDSIIKVKKVIKHEKYTNLNGNITNDIAILELESAFKKSPKIDTVEAASEELKDNAECTVAAWGVSDMENPPNYSKPLQVTTANKINNIACQKEFSITKITIKPENLCTSGANALCLGDEGAPLLCNKKIHGLGSSTSANCKSPGLPIVYVDVNHFKTWIKEHSGASFISVSMKLLAIGVFVNIRYLFMK